MSSCNRSMVNISAILMIVMLVIGINIFLDKSEQQIESQQYEEQLTRLKNIEWVFVESLITENNSKAKIQGKNISDSIIKRVKVEYLNDHNSLKNDILFPSSTTRLAKISSEEITGKFLNVSNDNNDLFVATKAGIISDTSLNCSVESDYRTWNKEIEMHWNKELASAAINEIASQGGSIIYWEFLTPDDPNHTSIKKMSLDELRQVYFKEGLLGLKGYEFLQPIYITDSGDIFENKEVSPNGTKSLTYKIIVVQGFNVVDLINLKYVKSISDFGHQRDNIERDHENYLFYKNIKVVVMTLILILSFICVTKIQHLYYVS